MGFEDSWLIKSSFITMHEMKACLLSRTKVQSPKNVLFSIFEYFTEMADDLINQFKGLGIKTVNVKININSKQLFYYINIFHVRRNFISKCRPRQGGRG
jgi:hypothetical protein